MKSEDAEGLEVFVGHLIQAFHRSHIGELARNIKKSPSTTHRHAVFLDLIIFLLRGIDEDVWGSVGVIGRCFEKFGKDLFIILYLQLTLFDLLLGPFDILLFTAQPTL